MTPRKSRRWWWLSIGLIAVVLVIVICDGRVTRAAEPYLVDRVEDVPEVDVAVVLGTSERVSSGAPNRYFTHRIQAAAALYQACKVHHLILSGDNRRSDYNEPMAMRAALIKAGVDSTHITLDFAGFRTLDSMVRAKEVFGQQRFLVVSQRFHNERAVYIARARGIEAFGFDAPDVGTAYGFRTQLREKLARVKVHMDDLFGVEPHFLGERVLLGTQVLP